MTSSYTFLKHTNNEYRNWISSSKKGILDTSECLELKNICVILVRYLNFVYLCFGSWTNRKQYEWMNEYEQQVAHIINIDVAVDYIVQKLNNVITQ